MRVRVEKKREGCHAKVAVAVWCNPDCPKDRVALPRDGESGPNQLVAGLERVFTHTGPIAKRGGGWRVP
jgi:sulfatase maturation enzyme AslB (radical SAM superfamily)